MACLSPFQPGSRPLCAPFCHCGSVSFSNSVCLSFCHLATLSRHQSLYPFLCSVLCLSPTPTLAHLPHSLQPPSHLMVSKMLTFLRKSNLALPRILHTHHLTSVTNYGFFICRGFFFPFIYLKYPPSHTQQDTQIHELITSPYSRPVRQIQDWSPAGQLLGYDLGDPLTPSKLYFPCI